MEPRVDFDDYCAARWRPLVRSAVLLGCSPPEAEDVVQAALEPTATATRTPLSPVPT